MKMTNIHTAILAALLAALPVSAFADGFGGPARVSRVAVAHEGRTLDVRFTLALDSLDLPSGNAVVYTPYYIGAADTVALPAVVVAGRREIIAADRRGVYDGVDVVRRRNGTCQSVPYAASVAWKPWMETGRLVLSEVWRGCDRTYGGPQRLLAEADFTPLPEPEGVYLAPAVEAVKVREAHGSAFLDFPVNLVTIMPDYRGNRAELGKIFATIDTMRDDPNTEITAITIHGFASPEGGYANNRRLAEGRAQALGRYVAGLYDIPDGVLTVGSTPENWDGLRSMVAGSRLRDRDALLAIIDSDEEPDAREARMRRMYPEAYEVILNEFYPALRRSDYTVRYTVRPFTTEEVLEMIRTAPAQVSQAELFAAAATFPAGSDEFNELMELAVRLFPGDQTANLNAAVNALQRGDADAAERYLDKAGDTPQAIHARGILAYRRGNLDEALRLLDESGVAPESNLEMVRKAIRRRTNGQNQDN